MAFWLSSPLIDPPTLFITAAALGWPFAIGKAMAAVGLRPVRRVRDQGDDRGRVVLPIPLRERAAGRMRLRPFAFKGKPVWRFWREDNRTGVFRDELDPKCCCSSSNGWRSPMCLKRY